MPLTAERLRLLLDYDRDTGIFRWRDGNNQMKVGSIAGCVSKAGYVYIKIDGKSYRAHRLAVLHVTGSWPKEKIDHRDLNKTNNRYSNLRDCSMSLNKANIRARRDNKCGLKGVNRRGKRWIAQIQKDGTKLFLGRFDTPESAHSAYASAATELFGEFARVA